MIRKIRGSEFVRSVTTLMTGTIIAQAVAYLVYPLITRIYVEEEIGELGLYTRFVAFIAAVATARYDFAMPITKNEGHAFSLFRLSLRIAFVCLFSVLIFGMCYALFQPDPDQYFIFVLLSVGSAYATVWINVGTNWAIRKKEFRSISTQRVINSLSVSGFRLLFGVLNWGAFGLLFGSFVGTLSSSLVFVQKFLRFKKQQTPQKERKRMAVLAKNYRDFPTVNLPHVLVDLGVDWIMAMSIALYYDKGQLGQYSHAFLMMKLPLSIVGQSIGQVFFNRASELVNSGASILPLARKSVMTLLLLSIIPFTIIFLFGDDLFAVVFGEKWRLSGEYAEILVPYLFLNFLISPISSLPLILGRQREMFLIGIAAGLIQLVSFVVLPRFSVGLEDVLAINSSVMVCLYLFIFVVFYRFIRAGRISR